jgi:hypothetical protein
VLAIAAQSRPTKPMGAKVAEKALQEFHMSLAFRMLARWRDLQKVASESI